MNAVDYCRGGTTTTGTPTRELSGRKTPLLRGPDPSSWPISTARRCSSCCCLTSTSPVTATSLVTLTPPATVTGTVPPSPARQPTITTSAGPVYSPGLCVPTMRPVCADTTGIG